MIELIPTLLAHTRDEFEHDLRVVEKFSPLAHIDVLDGSLVNTHAWADPDVIGEMLSPIKYELHLMIENPQALLESWAVVPSVKRVLFHIEATPQPREVIEAIRFYGWQAGVAINPETPLSAIAGLETYVDEVMFMTVHPGKSGAKFIPDVLKKISEFAVEATLRENQKRLVIGVDGGVNEGTVGECIMAGATRLRAHHAIFGADTAPADALKQLYELANEARGTIH